MLCRLLCLGIWGVEERKVDESAMKALWEWDLGGDYSSDDDDVDVDV